jgi:hypothetical protein
MNVTDEQYNKLYSILEEIANANGLDEFDIGIFEDDVLKSMESYKV